MEKDNRYILARILIEMLLKENLITPKEFEEIDKLNRKSFSKNKK